MRSISRSASGLASAPTSIQPHARGKPDQPLQQVGHDDGEQHTMASPSTGSAPRSASSDHSGADATVEDASKGRTSQFGHCGGLGSDRRAL